MDNVALFALVHGNPDGRGVEPNWLAKVLSRCCQGHGFTDDAAAAGDPALVRAWSVGGVQGTETLVQSRPVVRELRADFIADFLRAPSQTTLAAHAAAPSGPGAEDIPVPRLGLARFQRWLGVRAEGALAADEQEAQSVRERLKASLPDFLVRALSHTGDRELTIFGFLAALHASGDLNKPYIAPPQIRRALASLDEVLGRPARVNLFVCDGRTLGVLHRGGRLLVVDAPAPTHTRRAVVHGPESGIQASLLIHDDSPAEPPPLEKAEVRRLPEGIFTLSARQPGQLERE